jgi:hypothetical protein
VPFDGSTEQLLGQTFIALSDELPVGPNASEDLGRKVTYLPGLNEHPNSTPPCDFLRSDQDVSNSMVQLVGRVRETALWMQGA